MEKLLFALFISGLFLFVGIYMAYTSVFNNKKYTKLHYLANQKSNRVDYFGFIGGVFFTTIGAVLLVSLLLGK